MVRQKLPGLNEALLVSTSHKATMTNGVFHGRSFGVTWTRLFDASAPSWFMEVQLQ